MKNARRTTGVCVLALAALAAPGAAEAKNYGIDGHVVAPPTASKGRLVVPILLSERAERRLRLGKGLVRVSVPARTRLQAPAPNGRGTVAILPSALRVGDQLKASAPLTRRAVKRLKKRAVPGFLVRKTKVVRRSSALSTDELTQILGDLGRQLNLLTGRVNSLASLTSTQVGGLLTRLESHTDRMNTLTNTLGTLETSVTQFLDRLTLLESAVPNTAELIKLQSDVTSLLSRATSLESVTGGLTTNLGNLTTTVAGLQGSLTGLSGQITALTTSLNGLSSRMTSAETTLAQLPGLIAQVSSLDSSLVALTGRVTAAEGLLTTLGGSLTGLNGTVAGLTTTTNGLTSTVNVQGLDIASLTTTVGTLDTGLTGVQSSVATLQGTVGGLQSTVTGLTGQVNTLNTTVGILCGPTSLLNALC